MDRRSTPFSGRVAHVSLKGRIDAPLTEGEAASVVRPVADLLARPGGPRDRQVVYGEAVTVIDRDGGMAYVQAGKDGYCGWLVETAVGPAAAATHRVASPATHLYSGPKVQFREHHPLYFGSRVTVTAVQGKWAETAAGFVPLAHLAPADSLEADPVAVAEAFLNAPYLWGGNTVAGIDCSGLAQTALLAAGIACPGDSDQQERQVGRVLAEGEGLRRGDLVFWKGHVALLTAPDRIIHANGATMSVAFEGLQEAIARIEAQGEGRPTLYRRPIG